MFTKNCYEDTDNKYNIFCIILVINLVKRQIVYILCPHTYSVCETGKFRSILAPGSGSDSWCKRSILAFFPQMFTVPVYGTLKGQ